MLQWGRFRSPVDLTTLLVQIGVDHIYRSSSAQKPDLPPERHPALGDTGASESCIDSDRALGLSIGVSLRGGVQGQR